MDTTSRLFRVMIVDDIPESGRLIADDLLHELCTEQLKCTVVSSLLDAQEVLEDSCIDFVITDYNLGRDDPSGGLRLLEHLKAIDANIDAAIYTRHYSDTKFTDAALQSLTLLSPSKVRVRAAVNIGDNTEPIIETVRNAQRTWIDRRIELHDELGLGGLLLQAGTSSWATDEEADAEALRILSAIYGNAGLGTDPIRFRVRVPGDDAYDVTDSGTDTGHSGALVVYPEIDLDFEDDGAIERKRRAVRTVLKLGAPKTLQDERDRFRNVVTFGVPLRGRVEFLGFSRRHGLAGLCYGFAGGVFGEQVVSMRRDLRNSGGIARAQSAVRELFSKHSKSWYRQQFREKISQNAYVIKSNRRPLDDLFGRFLERLLELPTGPQELVNKRTRQDDGGVIRATIGSTKLEFPARELAGSELLRERRKQTLVHGDMHAGNVLLEILERDGGLHKQRTVLIDFADAGRGPRAEDLAALYASLAHELARIRAAEGGDNVNIWLAGEFRRDRLLLSEAFGLSDRMTDGAIEHRTIALDRIGSSFPDPTASDALFSEIVVALAVNFSDLTFGELSSSLLVRAIEQSIHERNDCAFLRLAGLAAVVRGLLKPRAAG